VINENNIQDDGFVVSPAIMVYKQSQSIMVNYGAGITKWNVFTGVWLRNNLPFQFTSIIFSLGYTFNKIRIGYSYDFELPSLNNLMPASGAHEISLVMILPIDPRNERYGPVRCPKNIEVK
jgi:hypothetical protein